MYILLLITLTKFNLPRFTTFSEHFGKIFKHKISNNKLLIIGKSKYEYLYNYLKYLIILVYISESYDFF